MTRRIVIIAILVAAALAAAVPLYRYFFPDDETRIIRVLDAAADAVSCVPGESAPAAIGKMRRLEALLDEQVEFDLRANRETHGRVFARGELVSIVAGERRAGARLKVELTDFTVTVDGDSAKAEAAAAVRYQRGDRDFSMQEELKFSLVRRDKKWRIAQVVIRNFMEK